MDNSDDGVFKAARIVWPMITKYCVFIQKAVLVLVRLPYFTPTMKGTGKVWESRIFHIGKTKILTNETKVSEARNLKLHLYLWLSI